MQTCTQCQQPKELTTANFGVNTREATGFRTICKSCFSQNRSAKKTQAVRDLKNQERVVKAAKKALEHPEGLSMGQLHKAQQIVGLAEKKRQKLLAKIDEQRNAAEHAKKITATSPSLDRVRAQFYCNPFAQSHPDLTQMVVEMKAALMGLVGSADEMARDYLTKLIGMVAEFVTDQADAAKEQAQYEQDVIDGRACQDAADAIHDKFAGLFSESGSRVSKDQLKARFQVYREEAQRQHKAIKPDDRNANGASCNKISSRILGELTAIASRLGKAGTEIGPGQSLENLQSLEWSQQRSGDEMRQYVRHLTAKLEEARSTMTPKEYEKKYLQLPVAPKDEIIVWRVRLLNGAEEWFWPSGNVVRRGVDIGTAEVVKDALHGWCLAPSPVGAELEDENKPVGKLECVQEDNGQFVYKVVDPDERWEQGNDGLWTKVSGGDSPWSKPEPITFKVGPAQPEAAHREFRSGYWFTEVEVAVAEQGPDLKEPPVIFAPLTRTKADSIAVEPPMTKEELAKWSREPSRWKRHEEREKFRKEQEAAMVRGVFIWDKNQATTN
jgi:hypothetical protein